MSKFEVQTDRIQINAPIDFVWGVLTEVEKYGEWNPFTPQARTDFKIGSPRALASQNGTGQDEDHRKRVCIRKTPSHCLDQDIRSKLVPACRTRTAPGAGKRDELQLPQHGSIDRCTGSHSLAILGWLYAPRIQ